MTRTHAKGPGESKLVRNLPGDKQRNFAVAVRQAKLTQEEERVLRMKKGVAAPPDHELEFRGKNNDLTRRCLAQMERGNLQRTGRLPPKPRPDLA